MRFFLQSHFMVRIALFILLSLMLIACTANWWLPHDPLAINLSARLQTMSQEYWLGTDHLGRDIFSRLLAAVQVSLGSVVACLGLVIFLGLSVGGSAGLIGGRYDQLLMRVADLFMTFPTSILSFFLVGVLGTGLNNVVLAIALSHWAWYARMVRSIVITYRKKEFVLAAQLAGGTKLSIFINHLLSAVIPSLLVLASLDIGHMMLHVAGMSFLGLGVATPTPEWGVMINDARQFIWTQPLLMLWPGLALFISVMAFNIVGDALRDYFDPHIAKGHVH